MALALLQILTCPAAAQGISIPGETGPASEPSSWDDSVAANPRTARLDLRGDRRSSRKSLSLDGPIGSGWGLRLQEADPGGVRRRSISWRGRGLSLLGGDLDPWEDEPLLEGATRFPGTAPVDEADSWLLGSGLRPNGLDAVGATGEWTTRGRLRVDRRHGRNPSSGTVGGAWGRWSTGLRADETDSGTTHVFSAGWSAGAARLRAAMGRRGAAAFWLHLDTTDGAVEGAATARWIQEGFRHGGIPSDWPGTRMFDAALRTGRIGSIQAALRARYLENDSVGMFDLSPRLDFATGPWLRWTFRNIDRWQTDSTSWHTLACRSRWAPGTIHPWVEQAWSDSGRGTTWATGIGMEWSRRDARVGIQAEWIPGTPPSLKAVQEHSLPGELGLRVRFQTACEWSADPNPNAQGTLECAW